MFYTFNQNNTGGSFRNSQTLAEFVIIEADTASEANDKAECIGVYFGGVDDDIDCPCCGDRWHPVSDSDGKVVPHVYHIPLDKFRGRSVSGDTVIHYKSGRVARFASGIN